MTEDLLIRHTAPTLAGLKTANPVNCRCDNADKLLSMLSSLNRRLGSKGVRFMPLRVMEWKSACLHLPLSKAAGGPQRRSLGQAA